MLQDAGVTGGGGGDAHAAGDLGVAGELDVRAGGGEEDTARAGGVLYLLGGGELEAGVERLQGGEGVGDAGAGEAGMGGAGVVQAGEGGGGGDAPAAARGQRGLAAGDDGGLPVCGG